MSVESVELSILHVLHSIKHFCNTSCCQSAESVAVHSCFWEEIFVEASQLWQHRGKTPDQVKQLMMSDMLKYRLYEASYISLPTDGELSTLKLYWQNISRDDVKAQLPWLALFLLDIKPHAADSERTFSLMDWIHSAGRSQLASKTTTALAMIRMSYSSQKARDSTPKPTREVDMIMQQEQLAAGVTTKRSPQKLLQQLSKQAHWLI